MPCLFVSRLGIELEPDDISSVWNVWRSLHYQSSRPMGAPLSIS